MRITGVVVFAFALRRHGVLAFSTANKPCFRETLPAATTHGAFSPSRSGRRTASSSPSRRLYAKSSPSSSSSSSLNEFSRTVDPERLRSTRRRDYVMEITANEDECTKLAERFDLPAIHSLAASVSLRPEGSRTGDDGIHVQGTITASVTRTCVRTSQDFLVDDLKVPLVSLVRPVMPLSSILSLEQAILPKKQQGGGGKKNKKTRKTSYRPQDRNLDDMDVLQLQRMLQQDISADDDSLMEDEAIYPTGGMIDVGELVAQLFWLSLDPYPKKPGTDPVQASISSS